MLILGGPGGGGPPDWLFSRPGFLPGHSPADPEQSAPHRARARSGLEAGGVPEVLPGARRALFLPAVGGVHGQVPPLLLGRGGGCGAHGSPPFLIPSGPIRAYILAHEDAIQLWRNLMGPTKVFRARYVAPDSIRGRFGLTDTRNTTHGSDSVVSARREIATFFPDFDERRWYQEEEPGLRSGPVYYDPEGGIHCPQPAAPASDLA
ncbi:nucleoside diphosphate kinase 6 isoform X1 [Antechinus flavipes]|uniref:nucleoside diphosphate kinase 6 isoform X1 n=1 Tax=Antechinus flavipes TaxID=38775 RepID=UPI002236B734|nr:nucleoside diphosphate kinase 6 isoform X1 [Antechinus flavipes]